tara:strand:- start:4718 stop:5374 length:657 start_codon:yes stop_codon:yes gene_type:complete
MNDFAEKLRILRTKELKITQRECAHKLDVPLRTYEAFERGEYLPPNERRLNLETRMESLRETNPSYQDIRQLCAILKSKIPYIEYDDTWHEASEHLKNAVTINFKENLFKLSETLIALEKMWDKKSIYEFDHKELQILENQKIQFEINLKEIVRQLNYENINYFLKKGNHVNQVIVILQSKNRYIKNAEKTSSTNVYNIGDVVEYQNSPHQWIRDEDI